MRLASRRGQVTWATVDGRIIYRPCAGGERWTVRARARADRRILAPERLREWASLSEARRAVARAYEGDAHPPTDRLRGLERHYPVAEVPTVSLVATVDGWHIRGTLLSVAAFPSLADSIWDPERARLRVELQRDFGRLSAVAFPTRKSALESFAAWVSSVDVESPHRDG